MLMTVGAAAGFAFLAGRMMPVEPAAHAQSKGESSRAAAQPGSSNMDARTQEMMMAWARIGTPGEHHEVLDRLVGEWKGDFSYRMTPDAEMMTMPATVKREWVLGGRFLKETVEAETEMGPFTGIGYIGYDIAEGVYEMVWMDSMSTAMYDMVMVYDEADEVFRMRGSARDPLTGHTILQSGEMNISKEGVQTSVGHAVAPDGRIYQMSKGRFTRVEQ
jgi:hypothetical protein